MHSWITNFFLSVTNDHLTLSHASPEERNSDPYTNPSSPTEIIGLKLRGRGASTTWFWRQKDYNTEQNGVDSNILFSVVYRRVYIYDVKTTWCVLWFSVICPSNILKQMTKPWFSIILCLLSILSWFLCLWSRWIRLIIYLYYILLHLYNNKTVTIPCILLEARKRLDLWYQHECRRSWKEKKTN